MPDDKTNGSVDTAALFEPNNVDDEGKAPMNWREHVRVIALLANLLLVLFLVGTRGWFWSIGFGVPFILPPLLAIVALLVNQRRQ